MSDTIKLTITLCSCIDYDGALGQEEQPINEREKEKDQACGWYICMKFRWFDKISNECSVLCVSSLGVLNIYAAKLKVNEEILYLS